MDIDIDFSDRQQALNLIKHIPAAINRKGEWIKHNTGVFVTAIPADPITGMSSLDYKEAEALGFFKVDLLNVSLYNGIQSKETQLGTIHEEQQ